MACAKTTIAEGQPFDDYIEEPSAATWVHKRGWDDRVTVHIPGTSGWATAVGLLEDLKAAVIDKAPDNYALFAAVMYYSDWHWSTGKAKKEPEIEEV